MVEAITTWFRELYEEAWEDLKKWFWETFDTVFDWLRTQFWAFVDWIEAYAISMGIDIRGLATQVAPAVEIILDLVADFAWILPIYECTAIITTAYASKLLIRLVRHLLGWTPGIEG
ncbi:MAG: hypothetical protein AAGB26_07470 [Planctomycetota bacterium]